VTSSDDDLRLDGSGRYSEIELQKYVNEQWERTLYQRFYPDTPFRLTPGVYRLVYMPSNEELSAVVVGDIVIVPGKSVEVTFSLP
jgi:hypothetical protein